MAEQKSAARTLPRPLHAAASAVRKVPGAETVGRAAEGALDRIGAVSPRGRRVLVYTGAGVLGVAGLVEWPVAVTGAAVAWLTQPRGRDRNGSAGERGGAGAGTWDTADAKPAGTAATKRAGGAKKTAAKSTAGKSTAARAGAAKKASSKSTAAKSTAAKSTASKKSAAAKSTAAKKSTAKKSTAKKTASPTRGKSQSGTKASSASSSRPSASRGSRSRKTAAASRTRTSG